MKWKQFFIPAKNMNAEEARGYMSERKEGEFTLLDVRNPVNTNEREYQVDSLSRSQSSRIDCKSWIRVSPRSSTELWVGAAVLLRSCFRDVASRKSTI